MTTEVSITTLASYVGQTGRLRTAEGLEVEVRILSAKQSYGRSRVLIAPLMGEGSAWVSLHRVILPRRKERLDRA